LELKSSRTFLAIKHCQGTKSKKVIKQLQSLFKKLVGNDKNEGESLAILIAMAMQRYDSGCIAQ
jgi:hypothetical protein